MPIRAPPQTGCQVHTQGPGPAQGLGVRSGPRSTAYLHSLSGVGFNFIFQSYSFQFILQALDFNQPRRVLWAQQLCRRRVLMKAITFINVKNILRLGRNSTNKN